MSKLPRQDAQKPSLLEVTWSLIAAFVGVQSDANLDRDDQQIEQHGFMPYIIVGIALTFCFVLAVYLIVQLILSAAT